MRRSVFSVSHSLTAALLLGTLLLCGSAVFGAEQKAIAPAPKDKCPVCGMFVAKFPDWVMRVGFKDGTSVFFDGGKDMFKFLLNVKKYAPAKSAADVADVVVKDYYTVSPIDGRSAFYVEGSDVYGPMGRELIPFAKMQDAREFMKDHKGKRLLRFDEVTAEVLLYLD
jgi:nitrous oxide reductase accessory protein NosL